MPGTLAYRLAGVDPLLDLHSGRLDVPSLQTEDLTRSQAAENGELPDEALTQTELREALEHFFAGHCATWVLMRPPRSEE